MPLLCCDVGLVSKLRLTAGCVLMDLASPAVSGTSVVCQWVKKCCKSSCCISICIEYLEVFFFFMFVYVCEHRSGSPFGTGVLHLNFSTPCM